MLRESYKCMYVCMYVCVCMCVCGLERIIFVVCMFVFLVVGVVELKSEEYFDVYVSHINSPTSFYVQHVGGDNTVSH